MVGGEAGFSRIALSGPMTLYELSEVRDTLRAALAGSDHVRLDLETTGPWDVAGLQLLIACAATGRQLNRTVRLVNVPRTCVEVAERSGLSDWLHEAADSFL
jgi:ABC-type transporter Mla MlaB component